MAYAVGDFLVNIQGVITGGEVWSNTWAFSLAEGGTEKQGCVDALHGFYNDLAAICSDAWKAQVATGVDLFLGQSADYAFEEVVGAQIESDLPTQCAIRVSLSDGTGVRGGPFLTGFTTGELAGSGGLVVSTAQILIADELEQLAAEVALADAALGIHRPTTETVVAAVSGRVGQRFDVIRKRANDILEQYATVTF